MVCFVLALCAVAFIAGCATGKLEERRKNRRIDAQIRREIKFVISALEPLARGKP